MLTGLVLVTFATLLIVMMTRLEEMRIALASAERPDLILLDLVMPRVDGFEALRRLKADSQTRGIPVIVLSNLGTESDQSAATAAGAAGFFVKASLSLADLVADVRTSLSKNR